MLRIFICVVVILFASTAYSITMNENNPDLTKGTVEVMTIEQAISLALSRNPEIQAYAREIKALEGRLMQARLLSNPELNFEMENFYGSKEFRRLQSAETTVALSQQILLGGKRSKRIEVASLDRSLSEWDYRAKYLDVIAEVRKAFIDVIAAQERLSVNEDIYRLSEQSYNTASALVQAGRVSPIDETKASAQLSVTSIELERAKRSLEAARKRLSTIYGGDPLFNRVEGRLEIEPSIPSFDELTRYVDKNPDVVRWSTELEGRRASLNLEKAKGIPDVTVSAGFRRLRETDDNAFVAALSIPFPLFDRNQGGIREAQERLRKAEAERNSASLRVHNALIEAYRSLSEAFIEATTLRNKVLPQLESAFDAVHEGYRQGKFKYLDVLDAQRSLFDAKNRYIEALAFYKKSTADIERLTGKGGNQNEK
jgi:cobalt-zinc-cadmium efflux system outer membrane protein